MELTTFRRATSDDLPFLETMLAVAAEWRGTERQRPPDPTLSRYLEDWGRSGDLGIIAEAGSAPVGAGWWRYFPRERPGYGFIGEEIPEITLAVTPALRRQGIGRALLAELIAAAERCMVRALSLSVEADNPAVSLYRDVGFETVIAREGSITMRVNLGRAGR